MANSEQFARIKQGVVEWNAWRKNNFETPIDLSEAELVDADLRGANLRKADLGGAELGAANLSRANLRGAYLGWANLLEANLRGANLAKADLVAAYLIGVDFSGADLKGANLIRADLTGADLTEADLTRADLTRAILVGTNLKKANLTECHVFGISVWDVNLERAIQKDLIITGENEPVIEIDRLDLAQFVYLLLNNSAIRNLIETITSKVVLILGRFSTERKSVLDALRSELRRRNYLPILLDFEKPASRDITETASTLAHMARFVIADITDARSIPQELMTIVPSLPSVSLYESEAELMKRLAQKVILPAEAKLREIRTAI